MNCGTFGSASDNDTDWSPEHFDKCVKYWNYTQPKEIWKPFPPWEVGLKVGLAAVIMLVSLIGNGLVLAVLIKKKSLRNVTNMLIANLAVADILVTLATLWIHVVDELTVPWVLGAVLCKYNPMIQVVAYLASVLTMTAISMERFFGIVTPFLFCSYKKGKMTLTVTLIWLVAIVVAVPEAVYTRLYQRQWADYEEVWCQMTWPNKEDTRGLYRLLVCIILYVLPMTVMTGSYAAIIAKLRAKRSEITELNNNMQRNKHTSRKRVIAMLIVLLAVFTICWLPQQTLTLYYEFELHRKDMTPEWMLEIQFCMRFLANSNSAFNPIIFICFSQKIRRAIYGLVFKKAAVWKRSANPPSRANSLRSSSKRTWV